MRSLLTIMLAAAMLPALGQAQTVNICDRTQQVRDEIMRQIHGEDCAAVDSADLRTIRGLYVVSSRIRSLQASDFNGLVNLDELSIGGSNDLRRNQLAELPDGVFDGLARLQYLNLSRNQLTTLPEGVFDGLTNLRRLVLRYNPLTTLPEGVFDGPAGLRELELSYNRLTALPAGVFDGLTSLYSLVLYDNRLSALPEGLFDDLTSLQYLRLQHNHLTTLPAGLFDNQTMIRWLDLRYNELTSLPAGVFDGIGVEGSGGARPGVVLDLQNNYLWGLTADDPLFENVCTRCFLDVRVWEQIEPPEPPEEPLKRIAAAVPLMVSASHSTRQGFVRIINESSQSGMVRIRAFDDAGNAASPFEVQLGANQAIHFNGGDLENGNAAKGIATGIGRPAQGDWRLDLETRLNVRVLAYVRTGDGFLTAMHDVAHRYRNVLRNVRFFNPASNTSRVSRLRLVNTGANAESVAIYGYDDRYVNEPDETIGESAGPVSLTLAAGESRTLSALDLENGAQGLTGTLGDGAGKWFLVVEASQSVIGMNLLDSASGHLSNLSTTNFDSTVPLLVSASDSMRQGFVRIINFSGEPGMVRISAFDDAGTAADPVEVSLGANLGFHFNAGDLENGNANKALQRGLACRFKAIGAWALKPP